MTQSAFANLQQCPSCKLHFNACISERATLPFSAWTGHHSHLNFAIAASPNHTTTPTLSPPSQPSWTAPRATTASRLPPRPSRTGRQASLPRARAPTRSPTRSRPTRQASRTSPPTQQGPWTRP